MRGIFVGLAGCAILVACLYVGAIADEGRREALERVAFIATAAGPPIVILSTVLIVMQIREAADAVRSQLFDATSARMLDLSNRFVEFPELRPYFYEGMDPEEADEPLRSRVYALAEMHLDFFDTELLRKRQFRHSLRGLPSLDPWITDSLSSSPAMCHLLVQDASRQDRWYNEIHQRHFSARLGRVPLDNGSRTVEQASKRSG